MPKWTKDQSLAINTRGGKVIVSAAAGSGKTAVLSERVVNLILEGVSIDELLIVTFTKAAAEEMKIRIKEKVETLCNNKPNDEYLRKQLSLIPIAKITTMDSFYSELVKSNFNKLKIDKNFEILSKEEENILKEKVLFEVLENSFFNYDNYEDVLEMFSADNVSLIKSVVLKIDSFLQTLSFPEEFIKKAISNYDKESSFYKDLLLKQIRAKMIEYEQSYTEIIDAFYNESDDFDKILEQVRKEKNYITDFLVINDFNSLSLRLKSIEFDRLITPKGHKDDSVMIKYKVIRDELKKDIRKNYQELMFITDELFFEEQKKVREIIKTLFDIVTEYRTKLLDEKKMINSFSFGDICHFVIELLVKDNKKTILAEDISKLYKEILIDEYQDTNNMQNVIFNAISNNNENLFIVGDVKQSIYRFRSACPEIFNNDKESATKEDFPKLITLSKNFRSRKEVLDFCNFVFENTMSEEFGEVKYDKDEKLYLGASFENGKNLETEVIIIDGMEKNEDDVEDLTKVQKEAIVVADKIKDILSSNYKVYDNKNNLWRKVNPSDIVILLRSLKNSEVFANALRKRKISVYLESALEYFDNYEVKLVINFLKIIDNPYDDISLMSVLNSSLIEVDLDYISNLRSINKYTSLYESVTQTDNIVLNDFFNKLKDIKIFSKNHTLSEILSKLYKDFDILPILSAEKDGVSRYKNLIQMINHAANFEEKKKNSLHHFIEYLESVILNKESLEGVNPLSDKDNVLITTIHKSKGLEYPIVFLSETGKEFNFKDLRSDVMINDSLGFVCNIKENKYKLKYESVGIMAFKEYEKSKMLSEELRILYVALTRAKEKIIITGFTNNLANLVTKASSKIGDKNLVSKLYLKNCKSYLDILIACFLRHPSLRKLRSFSMVIPKTFATESIVNLNIIESLKIDDSEFLLKEKNEKKNFDEAWFNKICSFKYESDMTLLPKYLSVSDLKQKVPFIRKPNFMDEKLTGSNLGTLYHRVLELLPVKKYGISTLNEELRKLVLDNKIKEAGLKLINIEDLFAYLTSDVYEDLLNSDKVYKEMPINFEIEASYYDKSLKSGKILTSGVIDLLFVKDDIYTIVDYKTDNVMQSLDLKKLYKKQLDLYEIAIKEKMNAKCVRKFIYSIKLKKFIEV